ncbi:hypothetical protein WJX72_006613 [[Myrmecia] bisecta]|uniref:DNA helicase n=1 Tax=[Myrmecia] bisecta TaxID=41462 RepID=A0AAW1PK92_9CHLO
MVSAAAKAKAAAKKAATAAKHASAAKKAGSQEQPSLPPAPGPPTALPTAVQLVFKPNLTARQRAILHEVAEQHGIPHSSSGEGDARRIRVGSTDAASVEVPDGTAIDVSDELICELLAVHLKLDAADAFAPRSKPAPNGSSGPLAENGREVRMQFAERGAAAKPGGKQLSLEAFVAQTLPLLELEKDAEVAQAQEAVSQCKPETAQAKGRALLNLRCTDAEGGLLGRTLLTLASNKGAGTVPVSLPPHKFSPHDVVDLKPNKASPSDPAIVGGVVYRVKEEVIIIAVEEAPDDGLDQPLRLEKLANEVTYKRLKETLQTLARGVHQEGPAGALVDVMFGRSPPRFLNNAPPWTPFNTGLDESQRRAVSRALAAKDVALIHGPPGTGKTTAVVEVILQEARRGSKVLATAASNIAVDNLVERLALANPKLSVVRMGHPARLLPQVLSNSLEAHVFQSDNSSLARDCRKEIKAANAKILKLGRKDYAERRALRSELRALVKEERQRQERAVTEVLTRADVICSTLTGVMARHLQPIKFDLVVIDEAAQALEVACWSALLKAPRAVLAGDHLQLPPTVISDEAMRKGLGQTLFERLQRLYGDSISEMLTVQYRMNQGIMQWSSDELYAGRLTAHASVAQHCLADLPDTTGSEGLEVLALIDTAGCDMEEKKEEEGGSTYNEGEAQVVIAHVQALIQAGIRPLDIGVITPYSAQVGVLRELRTDLLAQVEISTVDGFQGREKEAIVISMVRSNSTGEVGFLSDNRRMNVAVTRARRHCALVCDTETVSKDPFLGRLVQYFTDHGAYLSADAFTA